MCDCYFYVFAYFQRLKNAIVAFNDTSSTLATIEESKEIMRESFVQKKMLEKIKARQAALRLNALFLIAYGHVCMQTDRAEVSIFKHTIGQEDADMNSNVQLLQVEIL